MKYELTGEYINGLYHIRALRDIPRYGVKTGDLGGWIQSESNLAGQLSMSFRAETNTKKYVAT